MIRTHHANSRFLDNIKDDLN
jgi:hypothetical protein